MKMQVSDTTRIRFLFSLPMEPKKNLTWLPKKRSLNKLLTLLYKNRMLKKFLLYSAFFLAGISLRAQELQGRVTVSGQQVGGNVDKTVFTTLQNQLTSFITNRKWTSDVFQAQEKIRCNFLLNIESVDEDHIYKATLSVQAARPVYSSSYQTALINCQ